jgi:trimeric autotransporter adhesin
MIQKATCHSAFLLLFIFIFSCKNNNRYKIFVEEGEEKESEYDGPMEIGLQEYEKTKDPSLGYVPGDRLWNAISYTNQKKDFVAGLRLSSSYAWMSRGPIYDVVGPSNGNTRANNEYTSGRMRAILVDAADPTGNTVFAGGVDGGLWKTTNFLTSPANWVVVNDNFASISLTSICQDPTNSNIMYFATGEATSNSDAVFGRGVWKSIDHGVNWTQLPSSTNFWRCFKILCDASGNVYLGLRGTAAPLPVQSSGLVRSTNGGTTWTNITPSGMTSSNSICTDIEISSTGRLHASFGYSTGATGATNYRYTDIPSTVASGTWTSPAAGLPTAVNRIELAVLEDTVYAAPTTNSTNNIANLYRSNDGGANWTQQNAPSYTTSLSNGQGWYDITLAINPNFADSVMLGGLDAYLSVNAGNNITRRTRWVGATGPYVHADHHFMQWYNVGGERRIIIGCDGGIFLSRDNGLTFSDRNRNLSLKQFFSVSMHPTLTDYMIAGAQDNGSHKLNGPGLTSSVEVTGGDGAYVHIDQNEPQYQFTSYVYNQYRRSTDGGNTWAAVNLSTTAGLFINPFDYDDILNVTYCSNGSSTAPNNQIRRWDNPQTGSTNTILTLSALTRGSNSNATAFKVSPYTSDRVYIGSSRGVLVRLDNASTVTAGTADANTTAIGSASFSTGTINCIEVGTNDNNLIAIFSNYGVSNVWSTTDGGTNWTACDGNLPDMPVRWAVFENGSNSKVVLATEAGVYTTDLLNGASTIWTPQPGFPTVRTDMLKLRAYDNVIAAATHGRGIFTATLAAVLPVRNLVLNGSLNGNGKAVLNWAASDVSNEAKFILQYGTDGSRFTDITTLSSGARRYEHGFGAAIGYYRIIATEENYPEVLSNIVSVKNNKPAKGTQLNVFPNPVQSSASFELSTSSGGGKFEWQLLGNNGQVIQRGTGTLPEAGRIFQPVNAAILPTGRYTIRIGLNGKSYTSPFIKQ